MHHVTPSVTQMLSANKLGLGHIQCTQDKRKNECLPPPPPTPLFYFLFFYYSKLGSVLQLQNVCLLVCVYNI